MSAPENETVWSQTMIPGNLGSNIAIGNDVVQVIAGIAAGKVSGIAAMAGAGGGIVEILSRKNASRGIRVEVAEGAASIDVFIIARDGVNLHELFKEIQRNVKDAVENMTGLRVTAVNVFTQGLEINGEILKQEEQGRP